MAISRRSFLAATSAATGIAVGAATEAAAAEATQEAGGAGKPPASPNDRVNVACVGFGIMGQGDVETAAHVKGVQLVAVADIYEGRLTAAKERYGKDVFTSRDYREVLARKDVDAVIVATPDHWHARISSEALRAGKHVYCQKPMVQKPEDGHLVIAAQKETGRILQVGSQRVSSALYAKARELVRAGAIGQVHMIESFWDRNSAMGAWQYSIPPDANEQTVDWDRFLGTAPKRPFEAMRVFRWRNYRDYGTGVAGDLFVHQFSGIHFIMDSLGPERIVALGGTYTWNDGRDVPDLMVGSFSYPKTDKHPAFQLSLRVNFESGAAGAEDGQGFRFVGDEGVLSLLGDHLVISKHPRETETGTTAETFSKETGAAVIAEYEKKLKARGPRKSGMADPDTETRYSLPGSYSDQTAHHENFFNAIRKHRSVVEDAVFGLRAAGPAVSANLSYFEGRVVDWDPVAMRVKA